MPAFATAGPTPDPKPTLPLLARIAGAALLALAALPALAGPPTASCPGSPALAEGASLDLLDAGILSSTPLLPGTTVATRGADETTMPQIVGKVLIDESLPFSFPSLGGGQISGTLQQRVINAANGTCDCQWRIILSPASAPGLRITALRLQGLVHPDQGLFADFRIDKYQAGIPSTKASRQGQNVQFRFPAGIGPGQSSRLVFLDTARNAVAYLGNIVLVANDGSRSTVRLPAYVTTF